jgi:hypothetical protein
VASSGRAAPFLNFVLALAHSGESYDDFVGDASEETIAKKWGITPQQLAAVREGDLRQIEQYIQEEAGTDAPVVATIWVGKVPWPWVGTS